MSAGDRSLVDALELLRHAQAGERERIRRRSCDANSLAEEQLTGNAVHDARVLAARDTTIAACDEALATLEAALYDAQRALSDAELQNDIGRIHAEARYMNTRRDHGGVSDLDLHVLIAQSGLSEEQFAREVLHRDPRMVRRWLKGLPMPRAMLLWLSRVRSVSTTRNAITVVIDRHERRAARRHWPVQMGTVAGLEADEEVQKRELGYWCACGRRFDHADHDDALTHVRTCPVGVALVAAEAEPDGEATPVPDAPAPRAAPAAGSFLCACGETFELGRGLHHSLVCPSVTGIPASPNVPSIAGPHRCACGLLFDDVMVALDHAVECPVARTVMARSVVTGLPAAPMANTVLTDAEAESLGAAGDDADAQEDAALRIARSWTAKPIR